MKKFLYFSIFCLAAFIFTTCESDTRLTEISYDDYTSLSVNKNSSPEATAKCDIPPCSEETAWAEGTRYVNKGNWATYTTYIPNIGEVVDGMYVKIFAGQNMYIGDAYLDPWGVENVRIQIRLFEGWCLQNVEEPIKIEPYFATPPEQNPKVGTFTYKYDTDLIPGIWTIVSTELPIAVYYGIHLDVGCCD